MANVKDLIVNGAARVIGKIYASEFVGKLTGNVTGDLSGNASTATQLATARSLKITDDGTNTSVGKDFNGTADVTLNLPTTIKANLTGNASSATKATQDGLGNVITTTYATKDELSNFDYIGKANTWTAKNTFSAPSTVSESSESGSGTINITQGGLWAAGGIYGSKVYNAVWNDLADCIPVNEECDAEPGYCYCFDGEKYYKSSKYLDDGIIGIYSDTYGIHMGYKPDLKQIPVAVAGFALAYVDKDYPVGTPLTCAKNGYLTKIEKSDKIEWPERIVATYWKDEPEEYWGGKENKIKVNGRKWVKIV